MRLWPPSWRRRANAQEAKQPLEAVSPTVHVPTSEGPLEKGHALRGVSKLHAFNRYEIKYLVTIDDARELQGVLEERLDGDGNSSADGYGVWSLYYDTSGLRFYWEKIEGIRFRRKLRIRHYGVRAAVDADTPVFVEIKQRVNRVTQKRRVMMSYQDARALCDKRIIPDDASSESSTPFLEEVAGLASGLDLRPCTITGYQRQAFVGRNSDIGLRVTIDRRVRGRDRDLDLGVDAENRFIVPPQRVIVEVKANERVPYWLTDLTAGMNLQVVRVSKYCQSVEAFNKAPRSAFHVPEHAEDDLAPVRRQPALHSGD